MNGDNGGRGTEVKVGLLLTFEKAQFEGLGCGSDVADFCRGFELKDGDKTPFRFGKLPYPVGEDVGGFSKAKGDGRLFLGLGGSTRTGDNALNLGCDSISFVIW